MREARDDGCAREVATDPTIPVRYLVDYTL